jgi:hypothetical protein
MVVNGFRLLRLVTQQVRRYRWKNDPWLVPQPTVYPRAAGADKAAKSWFDYWLYFASFGCG